MTSPTSTNTSATEGSPRRVLWSLLVPGAAQCLTGRPRQGCAILTGTALMVGLGMVLGRSVGLSTELFFFLLVLLPWWLLQAYDATLSQTDRGWPLQTAIEQVWFHAHDLRYLGLLFLIVALMDLYIILVNPDYAMALFCAKPGGWLGTLAKIQSPTIHVAIGYGFLALRRWALLLYLAYAGFGLLNATANFACFGYGRVRTAFFLSLVAFTAYVWGRRSRFDR